MNKEKLKKTSRSTFWTGFYITVGFVIGVWITAKFYDKTFLHSETSKLILYHIKTWAGSLSAAAAGIAWFHKNFIRKEK